jgi:hypothetical protein
VGGVAIRIFDAIPLFGEFRNIFQNIHRPKFYPPSNISIGFIDQAVSYFPNMKHVEVVMVTRYF